VEGVEAVFGALRQNPMKPEDIVDSVLFMLFLSDTAAIDEIYIRRRTSAFF
jgi:NADP-dependent 3-hydroxy acid dehydrogenase YdfG